MKPRVSSGGFPIPNDCRFSDAAMCGDLAIEMFPAVTNTTLRNQLPSEIDGLEDALRTDRMRAARLLLDWASNASNFSISSELMQTTTDFVLRASAAEIYYVQFLPNKSAVYCFGMALFYDYLLESFAYDSFYIDFGDTRDSLTHTTVIVPVLEGTAWKHYVLDPTFNATFHDRVSGTQLDFFELIDVLDSDAMDNVMARTESFELRDWISAERLDWAPDLSLREVSGDRYVYTQTAGTLTHYLDRAKVKFAHNGYTVGLRGFVQLMRARIFSLGSSTVPAATEDFTRQLQVRGIPLGPS